MDKKGIQPGKAV